MSKAGKAGQKAKPQVLSGYEILDKSNHMPPVTKSTLFTYSLFHRTGHIGQRYAAHLIFHGLLHLTQFIVQADMNLLPTGHFRTGVFVKMEQGIAGDTVNGIVNVV